MNFRDVELLSAYLDGQLNPSDSARIKSRLESDPNLRAVYEDLASARRLLRQLPARKAPRNFTLTRKMAGLNPPLPRAYPVFRFATVLATLLLFFTFATNYMASNISAASAPVAYGIGGGGGDCGDCSAPLAQAPAEPAATEAPAAALAPQATMQAELAPTQMPPSADTARAVETPTAEIVAKNVAPVQPPMAEAPQPAPARAPLISSAWQIGLLILALICAGAAFALRLNAIRKWRDTK